METVHLDNHGRVLSADGRVLGILKPAPQKRTGIRCGACNELIPHKDWNLHRYLCKALGRSGLGGDCRNLTAPMGKRRIGMSNDEFARQVLVLARKK
ncbi:MAG: hypothetical protein JRI56_13120 [Deltaproteobacteria bacterium]|nr:hypothetical protein [Deltaproteobacteria bacterium]